MLQKITVSKLLYHHFYIVGQGTAHNHGKNIKKALSLDFLKNLAHLNEEFALLLHFLNITLGLDRIWTLGEK